MTEARLDPRRDALLVEARLGRAPQDMLEAAVVLEACAGVPAQAALTAARAMMRVAPVAPPPTDAAPGAAPPPELLPAPDAPPPLRVSVVRMQPATGSGAAIRDAAASHARHGALYEAEYAKQLDRLGALRQAICAERRASDKEPR
jgi:hypothetical protein